MKRIQTSSSSFAYDASTAAAASELVNRSKAALTLLGDVIQSIEDPIRIEELFYINENISNLISEVEEKIGRAHV